MVMGIPAPAMSSSGTGLLRRPKPRLPRRSHGAPPPGSHEALPNTGPPRCDKCHIAHAAYEVVIDAARMLYLYLCGHHMKKLGADLIARGYEIRKI
jgi:hypothetical protein